MNAHLVGDEIHQLEAINIGLAVDTDQGLVTAVVDGALCVRQMTTLSLTFDHRAVDGAPTTRFLQRVKHLIERPYLALVR